MIKPGNVKPFIGHPDFFVSRFALRYFTETASPDPDILLRALDALKGKPLNDQRFMLIEARSLELSPPSMERLADVISTQPQLRDLAELLFLAAPPMILMAYAEHFAILSHRARLTARRRVSLLKQDSVELFGRLERYAVRGDQSWDWSMHDDALYVLRELVGREDAPLDELRTWALDAEPEEVRYREILGAAAARYGKFNDLVPHLIENFGADDDLLNEETERTLSVLISPELVDIIASRYASEEWGQRLWMAGLVPRLKEPLAVQKLLQMLSDEHDAELRLELAMGLCDCLDMGPTVMDAIKRVIAENQQPDVVDLMELAYASLVILGLKDPDMNVWHREVQAMHQRALAGSEEWE